MADESSVIETWLKDRLGSDTALMTEVNGVYTDTAPQGAKPPYVMILPQPSRGDSQENSLGRDRCVLYRYYSVAVVASNSGFVRLKSAAARIRALLHKVEQYDTAPWFGIEEVDILRDTVPESGGDTTYYRGGIFRFIVQPDE